MKTFLILFVAVATLAAMVLIAYPISDRKNPVLYKYMESTSQMHNAIAIMNPFRDRTLENIFNDA